MVDSNRAPERRDLLKGALLGAAASSLPGCSDGSDGGSGPAVHTEKNVRWRLASSFPSSLDTIYGGAEVLAERVAAMTGGRFRIQVYQAGEVVPALLVMDAVQKGTVQVGQTGSYYYTGDNPALAFDTCVPFGLTARQQSAWLEEGGGLDLIRGLYDDFDIINFPGGNTGAQMGGWFKREIHTLADLKGLVMRIPGMGGKVMSSLGVQAQQIAGGEIYPSLERGAIDATEWVGPYDDEKLGFHKVARFYYYPGWWEPGPALSFLVHRKDWDALPKTYQEVFDVACRQAGLAMQTRYDAKNPPALARLIEDGVQITPFSEEILDGAAKASAELLDDEAQSDPEYRKILEAWRKFRADSYRWFGTAEQAYGNYAFGKV